MGATTPDIFGDAGGAEPATPGSYGEKPPGFRLPDATRLGRVRLQIADLERSLAYYQGTLGMRVLRQDTSRAVLGASQGDVELVELVERPGAARVPRRGRLGLYHFAVLLPDRAALGRFVRHLGETGVAAGASDHLVSEALYLQDPDNLGIEVYADRPRGSWRRVGRELMMASDPLDFADVAREAGAERWSGMPGGTVIGHVHLHVGDIPLASSFFSSGMGFDRTVWQYPGALFFGAGGYHHHLGTNIWAGAGAQPAAANDAQLLEWTVVLPDDGSVTAAADSLARAGYPAERESSALRSDVLVRDPWGTLVRLRSPAP